MGDNDAEHNVQSVEQQLCTIITSSLRATVPDLDVEPMLEVSKPGFGDYQCNNAMSVFSNIRGSGTNFRNPMAVGQRIQDMLKHGIKTWAPILPVKRAVLDFSPPNIAKEMHVGHIRSTIIGDTLAHMFEFTNVEVLRRNHVGDWGTQFGMLIEFLFEQFPDWEDVGNQAVEDLQTFYKASKKRFDDDPNFKEKAQQAVVRLQFIALTWLINPKQFWSLQGGEDKYRAAWEKICQISRMEFNLVYKRLNVKLEEKGESFYNPYITPVLEELTNKGMVVESCKDGWLAPRTKRKKKYPQASHVGFGLVLGSDGKRFRTRCSEVVQLVDLLDEAKARSKAQLIKRITENGLIADWTDDELDRTSEAIGYGAVKYSDLKNNRLTDYTFSFDQMLSDKGNTAVYLQYAHARIYSIIKKANKDIEKLKMTGAITLDHPDERFLGLHLIRFTEVVEQACADLQPHRLCDYLYSLSEAFSKFYTNCQQQRQDRQRGRDVASHSVLPLPRLKPEPQLGPCVSLTVGENNLYFMSEKPHHEECFEALVYCKKPKSSHEEENRWSWQPQPPPPYVRFHKGYSTRGDMKAYAVVGDTHILVSTEGCGTYAFDVARSAWSKAGDWALPFKGHAEYVPEHGLWFGFSSASDDDGCVLGAWDLYSTVVGQQQPVARVLQEGFSVRGVVSASRDVSLGAGNLCVAKFFEKIRSYRVCDEGCCFEETSRSFALLTGAEVQRHRGKALDVIKHKSCGSCRYSFGQGKYSSSVISHVDGASNVV
uniref:arginine--tRNA ligase n=1 Tax=Leersia perrieri TaxID=77586 RepID=A0A0D9UX06_9ORYZ